MLSHYEPRMHSAERSSQPCFPGSASRQLCCTYRNPNIRGHRYAFLTDADQRSPLAPRRGFVPWPYPVSGCFPTGILGSVVGSRAGLGQLIRATVDPAFVQRRPGADEDCYSGLDYTRATMTVSSKASARSLRTEHSSERQSMTSHRRVGIAFESARYRTAPLS